VPELARSQAAVQLAAPPEGLQAELLAVRPVAARQASLRRPVAAQPQARHRQQGQRQPLEAVLTTMPDQ
jgi:hypothetical protein